MVIQNGKIFKEDGKFHEEVLYIENGYISENTTNNEVIDGAGLYVLPGLIDIHFHGCVRHDFCDGTKESIHAMAEYELKNGITAICPASMTLKTEQLEDIFRCAAMYKSDTGAELVGIYMEGPFLSAAKKGAQNEAYLTRADSALFEKLQTVAGGKIKVLAIAPEEENALSFIAKHKDDVRISVAHTDADYDVAYHAFQKGAGHVTHLYNGMKSYHHREPAVIGAACDMEQVTVELICDGIHIHPSAVRTSFKMFGDNRIVMVSDSMSACGLEDGNYFLGGQEVQVNGKKAVLTGSDVLAGSVSNLMDCLRTAVLEMGIPLESAVKACTANPAKVIGVYDQMGSISLGKKANLVLVDENLNIRYVLKEGKKVQ